MISIFFICGIINASLGILGPVLGMWEFDKRRAEARRIDGKPFFYMAFACCVNVYMVSAHEQRVRRI